jgi:phosphohistidine phosphatase
MNLYLLRHGLATPGFGSSPKTDALRSLTPKGRKKMVKIAAALRDLGLAFDLIFSSPCLRARQTALIVADAFQARKRLAFIEELNVGASPAALAAKLRAQHLLPDNLLLVGHEPQLSGFISLLLTGSSRLQLNLKKAGLAKLSLASLQPRRTATLEWLLTPKQILAMR